jgi:hypothetical protein
MNDKLIQILEVLKVSVDAETERELELIMAGKKKSSFKAPTLAEFNEYVLSKGYNLILAEKAYKHYAEHGWKDAKGSPVVNWKQKVSTNWFRDEYKLKVKEVYDQPIRISNFTPEMSLLEKFKVKLLNREKINVDSLPDEHRIAYQQAKSMYDVFIVVLKDKTVLNDYEKRVLDNFNKFPC